MLFSVLNKFTLTFRKFNFHLYCTNKIICSYIKPTNKFKIQQEIEFHSIDMLRSKLIVFYLVPDWLPDRTGLQNLSGRKI